MNFQNLLLNFQNLLLNFQNLVLNFLNLLLNFLNIPRHFKNQFKLISHLIVDLAFGAQFAVPLFDTTVAGATYTRELGVALRDAQMLAVAVVGVTGVSDGVGVVSDCFDVHQLVHVLAEVGEVRRLAVADNLPHAYVIEGRVRVI